MAILFVILMCMNSIFASAFTDGSDSTRYSSFIRTISRNKLIWQVSEGACHSAMLVNMSREVANSDDTIWQLLPTGSAMAQDWTEPLLWNGSLMYTLRNEPAIIALNTRLGTKAYEWPPRSPLYLRWLQPRQIALPRGTRLVSPTGSGNQLILRSQGSARGASAHVYVLSSQGGTLAWQANMTDLTAAAAARHQLPSDAADYHNTSVTDQLVDYPGLMVAATAVPGLVSGSTSAACDGDGRHCRYPWGITAELWLDNGTVRWVSDALDPAPTTLVESTESVCVAVSSQDDDGTMLVYALDRTSGALLWTATCVTACRVRILDTHTLLVHEDPSKLKGLRALELSTGRVLWTTSMPKRPSFSCGATGLTSTDIVVACHCIPPPPPLPPSKPQPPPPLRPQSPRGPPFLQALPTSTQNDASLDPERPGSMNEARTLPEIATKDTEDEVTEEPDDLESLQRKSKHICMYSVNLRNGNLRWESSASHLRDADSLPPEALLYNQQPVVLPGSVVVALRHSVVAVRRSDVGAPMSDLEPSTSSGRGGDVLWRLPLPEGSVVEGWGKLELHKGLLLLRTSTKRALGGQADGSSQGQTTASYADTPVSGMFLALNPETGEVVWSASLGPTFPPDLHRPLVTAFAPGVVLLDRCFTSTVNSPGWRTLAGRIRDTVAVRLTSAARRLGLTHPPLTQQLLAPPNMLSNKRRRDDVDCCLDALHEATGVLLWSHCFNQGRACRIEDARELVMTILQALFVLGAVVVGSACLVLGYRTSQAYPLKRAVLGCGTDESGSEDAAYLHIPQSQEAADEVHVSTSGVGVQGSPGTVTSSAVVSI